MSDWKSQPNEFWIQWQLSGTKTKPVKMYLCKISKTKDGLNAEFDDVKCGADRFIEYAYHESRIASLEAKLEAEEEKNMQLDGDLRIAFEALKQINEHELNSQRPGGGHSTSASLSYEALIKLKEI